MRPLDGIRVLDLTKFIAGPLCTQYLGAMGAEVIKIEDPNGGDPTRAMPPFTGTDGATFLAMNCNKRSLVLDLKSRVGRAAVHRLAERCDIAVDSLGPGVSERLGVDRDTLRQLNPRMVHCAISGFGRGGPLGDQPGYELMMQAFTGIMSITGEPGGSPLRIGFSPLDQTTGLHALTGILAALRLRDTTGEGSSLEVSLYEAAAGLLGWHAQGYWINGQLPERAGSRHGSLCPYQAFMAGDGHLLLAVGSEHLWRKFCAAAGLEDMADDPRFRTNQHRVAHYEETVARIQERIATRSVAEWVELFSAHRIPSAPVNTLEVLLAHPQTDALRLLLDYEHPVGGRMHAVAHPVTFENAPRATMRPPPLLGEHSAEILAELGYGAEEIASLTGGAVELQLPDLDQRSKGRM